MSAATLKRQDPLSRGATSSLSRSPHPPSDDDRGAQSLDDYLETLVHDWCRILTVLGFTLIPAFYVLDTFMMPRELLPRFAIYRIATTGIVLAQFVVLRNTRPGPRSFLHGYVFALVVGAMIALMTTDLGGFHSTYYAGLNLVIMAVNLLLPWRPFHTALNSLLIISLYIVFNLATVQPDPIDTSLLINNLYFLLSTAIIAGSINTVKYRLVLKEFLARQDLQEARDALWGEMGVAKQIQTALLPPVRRVGGYEVAAVMRPADEVGGDYYDVIETPAGEAWVTIGDVSGHGVESGLVMMMTQTSLLTTVTSAEGMSPARVLERVNTIIRENVSRLGVDRYMTITALRLDRGHISYAGKHQDLLVYRADRGVVEVIPTHGTWLGLVDDLDGLLEDEHVELRRGDVLLLYTDGVTEATGASGEMFGDERLRERFERHAHLPVTQLVARLSEEIEAYTVDQSDDVTVVALRRLG